MVVLTVIALLLSVVVPDYVGRMKRAEEAVLQENLTMMRDALDKHYADAGKLPEHARRAGVQALPAHASRATRSRAAAPTWVAVPPADPKKGGVFDVQSARQGL